MEIYQIADTVTGAATQGLGFANFILNRQNFTSTNHLSLHDSSSDQPSARILQLSAVIVPVDIVASPPVRSNIKAAPRKYVRKVRRTKRRSVKGGGVADYGEDGGFFGDGGDGTFGGGGGGGSGNWNFGGFEGSDWDDSLSPSWSDPAFDFVYEVMSWIVLSNCVHFAFKKVMRIGDNEREKVPVRFTPIC
ncbi:hypothetical protein LguiB_025607 [Lonicera macranthoides]